MSWLVLREQGTTLGWRQGALVVREPGGGGITRTVPPHHVEAVHCYGAVGLTATARRQLLRRGVEVLFFSWQGRYEGRLVSEGDSGVAHRLSQLEALQRPEIALEFARSIAMTKVRGQRQNVLRAKRRAGSLALEEAAASMARALELVEGTYDVESLRGHEGQAAAIYFNVFDEMYRHDTGMTWAGRSRRPPRDPLNAALSYGYTLLQGRVESAIRGASLEPYVGALHRVSPRRPALVMDLMELWRPVLVDRLVLALVNRRQLQPKHFTGDARVGVYLDELGRVKLLEAFAELMDTRLMYTPRDERLSWSQIITSEVLSFRRALAEEPRHFQPFLPR